MLSAKAYLLRMEESCWTDSLISFIQTATSVSSIVILFNCAPVLLFVIDSFALNAVTYWN